MSIAYLSSQEISQQLLEIVHRQLPLPGKRQVKFNQVEVLLCYGLFYIMNPHRYGGNNIHQAPEPLHRLAAFFKRSPGSISSKMLNLDGSRSNGGRDEVLLFAQLSADPGVYDTLYKEILMTARHLSIGEYQCPDFLRLLDKKMADETLLLGQEELPVSNSYLLKAEQRVLKEVATTYNFLGDTLTEKLVEQRVRLTQHRFARDVLRNCGSACVFCGFEPQTLGAGNGFLRASHIKPWAASNPEERMDVGNGLAACPVHDVGFDQGYLTVEDTYAIRRAATLQQSILSDQNMAHYFGGIVRSTLLLPAQAKKPALHYLHYHQENIFHG